MIHSIISRDLRRGDRVATAAREALEDGYHSSDVGSDVELVNIADDNYGDTFAVAWSDGTTFDMHPGLRVTVTR